MTIFWCKTKQKLSPYLASVWYARSQEGQISIYYLFQQWKNMSKMC